MAIDRLHILRKLLQIIRKNELLLPKAVDSLDAKFLEEVFVSFYDFCFVFVNDINGIKRENCNFEERERKLCLFHY